jgi:hydrogenase expression/formation protein HypD
VISRCHSLLRAIEQQCTRPWTLMEVCGGQTHALLHHGIDQLLPPAIQLIHGPGCPVCVTDLSRMDQALALAEHPDHLLCTFGDMLRVPGSDGRTLLDQRSRGGAVQLVTSPLDVLPLAEAHPDRCVVFFAVGFETTAPATALLAQRALAAGLTNLKILVAHVRVVPVLEQLLADPSCVVQGILAAGHVCTVMGDQGLVGLATRHRTPVVITGFTAEDLLRGILRCLQQLERGCHGLENAYPRAVQATGNRQAQRCVDQVFEPIDTPWRGFGMVPGGGYRLRQPYARLATAPPAAANVGPEGNAPGRQPCCSAQVLQGVLRPPQCPSYANPCTPEHPLGAPMVSSEGACAAYYRYGR